MGKEARRKRDKRKKTKKTKKPADTGRTIEFDDETAAALREQFSAFERRFGRAPGPDDPLFFDPDLDVPTPITPVKAEAEIVGAMRAAGADPAFIYAYQQTGLILTEMNLDKVSEADRAEWDEAIDRYRRTHDGPVERDEAAAMITQIAVTLADLVINDDGEAFFTMIDALPTEEDNGLTIAMLFGTYAKWLVAARERTTVDDTMIEEAVTWARGRSGEKGADAIDAVAGLLRRDAEGTVSEMLERVGNDLVMVVSLAMLAAGLAVALGCDSAGQLIAIVEPDE